MPEWSAILAAAMLVAAALHDAALRTIPNALCALIAGAGIALRLAAGDVWPAVGAAGLVFALACLAWRLGALGGGDVKLLAAASLLVPPASVPTLLLAVALAGGVLALGYLAARHVVPKPPHVRPAGFARRLLRAEAWRIRRGGPLPYAVAIAAGALLTLPS